MSIIPPVSNDTKADTMEGPTDVESLSDETCTRISWKNCIFYFFRFILYMLFYGAACLTGKITLMLEFLIEKLDTNKSASNLASHPIDIGPIKDSHNNYDNLMEKQIEVDQIVSSTVDEALKQLNIEYNIDDSPISHNDENEVQTKINEVIPCTINESLNLHSEMCTETIDLKVNVETEEETDSEKLKSPTLDEETVVDQKTTNADANTNAVLDNDIIERKPKIRSPLHLITKTLEDNNTHNHQLEFNTKLNMNKYVENASNKILRRQKEKILMSDKKDKNWSKCASEKSDHLKITSNNHIKDTFSKNSRNNKEVRQNQDSFENRKPIMRSEKLLNLIEVNDDIFNLSLEHSLAICVTEDLQMNMGTLYDFKTKFGGVGALMDQYLKPGDVGEILSNGQYIFYLVVKRTLSQRPFRRNFENALYKLFDMMKSYKLTKLAIPKYGFDVFSIHEARLLISRVFAGSDIKVSLCNMTPELSTKPRLLPPKVMTTTKNLWEMEPQTDLILFINMDEMYLDGWNDEVVENINAKYPFKDRLKSDIDVKPVAPGDVLVYHINSEAVFCIFIKPVNQNPSYYQCMEDAFNKMQTIVSGYRYLGIQQGPVYTRFAYEVISRKLVLLQTIFTNHNSEVWLCGHTENYRAFQYNQYSKFVYDVVEVKNKGNYSKGTVKTKSKIENRKHNTNGVNNCNDSIDQNISGNIAQYVGQETIHADICKPENWNEA